MMKGVSKMRLCFDVDNALCNTTECVLDYINEWLAGTDLKIKDLKSYWIEDALPERYKWVVPLAFQQSEMWKNVKMIDGAAAAIEKLYNEGYEVYFATATTAENFRKKLSFLERNLPFFPKGYIKQNSISIKKKQLLNVDVLVDDYLGHLTGRRRYISLCYDYPWNRDYKENGDTFIRVYNWDDIYKEIVSIARWKEER